MVIKPDVYRMTGERLMRYNERTFRRNKAESNRRTIITNHSKTWPRRPEPADWTTSKRRPLATTRWSEQGNVDTFWESGEQRHTHYKALATDQDYEQLLSDEARTYQFHGRWKN